jgi:hypothetical protein
MTQESHAIKELQVNPAGQMGLSENVVCLNPMVNDQFPY